MAHQAKILIVDDRAENLIAIETVLASLGQELVCVRSGEAALAALRAEEFAIILLDVVMPGMDGFETAGHIKRLAGLRDVPIIFLTAADLDQELAFRGYAAGAVDFITKPFDPRVLRSKVAIFIDLYLLKARELRAAAELSARVAAVEEAAARLGDLAVARTDPAVAAGLASLDRDIGSLRGAVDALGASHLNALPAARPGRPQAGALGDSQPASVCSRMIRAGTPATTHRSGITPRTTEPAAITTFRPIRAPGKTIAPAPSHEPPPMLTGRLTGNWRPIGMSGSS